jgi:hypothetical protein
VTTLKISTVSALTLRALHVSNHELVNRLHRFLELPVEVKEQIYEWALRKERKFQIPAVLQVAPPTSFRPERARFPSLPAMCVTNKLERSIVTLVLVRNTMLRLTHATDSEIILKWLDDIKVSEKRFTTSVKKMQLCYKPDMGWTDLAKTHMSFAMKCPALAGLTISIPTGQLKIMPKKLHNDKETFQHGLGRLLQSLLEVPKPLTCDQMVKKFGLELITDCPTLICLTLHVPSTAEILTNGHSAISNIDEVADWCKETFMEAHGRALPVELLIGSSFRRGTKRIKLGKGVGPRLGSTWYKDGQICLEDEAFSHGLNRR